MRLNFIFPGKTKESFYSQGAAAYLQRLGHMAEVREVIVKAAQPEGKGEAAEAKARALESAQILERLGAGESLWVCDVGGRQLSSEALAGRLDALRQSGASGAKTLNLVVGGPWGLTPDLLERADLRLSFSPMTFPHELARLILLEQVYRAYTILNRIPYHK